jgi:hypothetical protein
MNEGVSPCIGLIGGAIGGVVCGAMLGIQGGRNLPTRIVLSLFASAIMVFICITLCCFGCGIGGYQMRFG